MKKLLLLPLGVVLLTIVSCGNKVQEKVQEEEVFKAKTEVQQDAPIAEMVTAREYIDTVGGRVYLMTIERRPEESLPVVTDIIGTQFYDNVVFLSVKCDSAEV